MNINLLNWILKRYTKAGETVLDPMAGTGSTGLLAVRLGRNAILVELEKWMVKRCIVPNLRKASQPSLDKMGRSIIIQGDARKLKKLISKSVNAVVFSPPYADTVKGSDRYTKSLEKIKASGVYSSFDQASSSTKRMMEKGYSKSSKNIGNFPYQKVDVAIFSPPYGEQKEHTTGIHRHPVGCRCNYCRKNRGNAGDRQGGQSYSSNPRNIGNLSHGKIDAVITSPPYSEGIGHNAVGKGRASKEHPDRLKLSKKYTQSMVSKGNIADLSHETYLEAMLRVYKGCFSVLKPRGTMILVTKNFVRGWKPVRLDNDTIKLCKSVGFRFIERWWFKLPKVGFWIKLNLRKLLKLKPHLKVNPYSRYEDVLVFRKPSIVVSR
jgi:DNA modification methylase